MTGLIIIAIILAGWFIVIAFLDVATTTYRQVQIARLHRALFNGWITKVQFRVLINDLSNPFDLPSVREVSSYLDELEAKNSLSIIK